MLSVPLLFVVTASTFLLEALIPGDIARTLVGPQASLQQYLSMKRSLGLDEPLWTRYWHWLDAAFHGSLGTSLFFQQSVTSMLNGRLEVTFSLIIGATLVAGVSGVLLGIALALQRGKVIRKLADMFALIGLAVPNFFLGLLLVTWFAVSIRAFPATGFVSFSQSPTQWLHSLVLPVFTLAVPGIALLAKQTRDAMSEALARPFIDTLRASGVSQRSIVFKHALRNAALPIVTVIGIGFIGALSGTVVVESVFAMPGLGGLAVQATTQHDVPLIQGIAVYFTIIAIAINLLVDLAYGWLDPRVRVS